jgi:hypothetical protein
MADETPVPAPEVPAPPPAAPVETAPPPAPTPEPVREPAPALSADQFSAMAAMLGPREEAPEAPEAAPPARERPPRAPAPVAPPVPTPPLPAQPAPEGPKRWGGRYDTPEALEQAYKEIEAGKSRAEQANQRLERLLLASLEGARPTHAAPAQPVPPPRPPTQWTQQAAHAAIREEAARLGLDDPAADPQRFIRAIAAALQGDDEARGLYVAPALHAIQQQAEQQRQIQTLQTAFYTQYPDLQQVRPELLRQVAQETEARLYRAAPETYGSPEYVKQWFDETAREARAVFRVPSASGLEGNGPASAPSPASSSPPKAQSAKPKGAPFAETPSPRPTESQLSGQALHLARVFGRPG